MLTFIEGQHKNVADRAISDVIEKEGVLKKVKRDLKRALGRKAGAGTANETLIAEAEIESLTMSIKSLEGTISERTLALGISETPKGSLKKLRGNTFLRIRMNALALREKIIQNLISHKFEMEKIERLVRYGDRMGEQMYLVIAVVS